MTLAAFTIILAVLILGLLFYLFRDSGLRLVLFIAGACLALFGFFYFANHSAEDEAYVYMQYVFVLLTFSFLAGGIAAYSKSRIRKPTEKEKAIDRRKIWQERRNTTRAGRRHW